MPLAEFVLYIKGRLSVDAEVLTDRTDAQFWTTPKRWSNVGVKIPGAVVRPACEDDVVQVVKAAATTSTPFVAATGGHSPWSSIGENGFVIDMSKFKGVEVDTCCGTVQVRGGVLHKEFQVELARHEQCTAIGDANTIGVIPFFLGGGISLYSGQFGFGSDNILSARVVTADGSLVEASDTKNPDLFWAIRGAGQFFGVVTELTIRTYPLSTLGSMVGGHCFRQLVYPISQAREVAAIMKDIMVDPSTPTSGHLMIVSRPPEFHQVIVINAHYIGDPAQAEFAFQRLKNLNPIETTTRMLLFENHSDYPLAKSSPGDYRSINLIGLAEFTIGKFLAMAKLHQDLITDYPDAKGTQVIFGWRAPVCQLPITDTSFGNAGQLLWL
ncbi:FAD-binding, type 2 [Penicillium griseofulvum]|uniref:FAD-binding, type 2 n=1 Tax=Penicillium patulum TaxID=5078 RepID=A0A135LC04_PENPA|nr:FAD-binding, type 2 [Penicillium griseofulvum]KXG46502.1 FAD-binding, type 2 [Penicillium griseofulvum]